MAALAVPSIGLSRTAKRLALLTCCFLSVGLLAWAFVPFEEIFRFTEPSVTAKSLLDCNWSCKGYSDVGLFDNYGYDQARDALCIAVITSAVLVVFLLSSTDWDKETNEESSTEVGFLLCFLIFAHLLGSYVLNSLLNG